MLKNKKKTTKKQSLQGKKKAEILSIGTHIHRVSAFFPCKIHISFVFNKAVTLCSLTIVVCLFVLLLGELYFQVSNLNIEPALLIV